MYDLQLGGEVGAKTGKAKGVGTRQNIGLYVKTAPFWALGKPFIPREARRKIQRRGGSHGVRKGGTRVKRGCVQAIACLSCATADAAAACYRSPSSRLIPSSCCRYCVL